MSNVLTTRLWFPDPRSAAKGGEFDGLVAIGGDLSVPRLLLAYRNGIFPWTDDPITWWSPDPRAIFELDRFHVPHSLARVIRKGVFRITIDRAFRRFVSQLVPNNPLVAIPRDDELYTTKVGLDLSDCQYTKAAGGHRDFPQLEGVKINGHWAIIYSKYDIGCALERHTGIECKGYTYDSALKIAGNIVIYSRLP